MAGSCTLIAKRHNFLFRYARGNEGRRRLIYIPRRAPHNSVPEILRFPVTTRQLPHASLRQQRRHSLFRVSFPFSSSIQFVLPYPIVNQTAYPANVKTTRAHKKHSATNFKNTVASNQYDSTNFSRHDLRHLTRRSQCLLLNHRV